MATNEQIEYDKERLEKNRETWTNILFSCQEHFEKQLSYISAGALGLSFFLIEKVIKDIYLTQYRVLLILGWASLASTLLLNLWSHMRAYKFHYKTIKEINQHLKGQDTYTSEKVERRTEFINKVNSITLFLLFLGIALIITYTSLNIIHNVKD